MTADVLVGGDEVGSGRLVLLHDPAGNAAWQGTFRCVTFARAEVDPEMVTDPLLARVGWSWLIDALRRTGPSTLAPSGTVTSVSSESFGGMADEPPRAEVEVRASWTPHAHRRCRACRRTSPPGLNYSVRRRGCPRCLPGWCRCPRGGTHRAETHGDVDRSSHRIADRREPDARPVRSPAADRARPTGCPVSWHV